MYLSIGRDAARHLFGNPVAATGGALARPADTGREPDLGLYPYAIEVVGGLISAASINTRVTAAT